MPDGGSVIKSLSAQNLSVAFVQRLIYKSHLHLTEHNEKKIDETLSNTIFRDYLENTGGKLISLSRLKKRLFLYNYLETPGEQAQFKNELLALCLPPQDCPSHIKPNTNNTEEISKALYEALTSSNKYQHVPPHKRQSYLRKTFACWGLLFSSAIEEYLDELELTNEDREKAKSEFSARFQSILKELNKCRYPKYVRFIRYNRYISSILDNQSEKFELNLAPYEFFDKGKQYIGLVKITERLFGVQTIYFLEVLFRSFNPEYMPAILIFLQDSVFHHLNFILQFIDSVFFTTGAIVTYRDKGFRRWSKVFFAMSFLLLATIPWLLTMLAVKITTIFFKIGAVVLGMIKSLFDLRYYLIKRTKNKINIAFLKNKLNTVSMIRASLEIKKSHRGKANPKAAQYQKTCSELILEEFLLKKDLAKEKELTELSRLRMRDKRFALFVSTISLVGMILAACIPFMGYAMWSAVLLCVLFSTSTAIKFTYRILTFTRTELPYEILIDFKTSPKILHLKDKKIDLEESFVLQMKYYNYLQEYNKLDKKLDELREALSQKSNLFQIAICKFKIYRTQKQFDAINAKILNVHQNAVAIEGENGLDEKTSRKSYHQMNALLVKQLSEKKQNNANNVVLTSKLSKQINQNSEFIKHYDLAQIDQLEIELSTFNSQIWSSPEAQFELIRAISQIEPSFQEEIVYFRLKRIANLKEDQAFYKRKNNQTAAQNCQNQIDAILKETMEDKDLMADYMNKIYNLDSWFKHNTNLATYVRFLMEIYAAIPEKERDVSPTMIHLKEIITYLSLIAVGETDIQIEEAQNIKRSTSMPRDLHMATDDFIYLKKNRNSIFVLTQDMRAENESQPLAFARYA